MNASRKDLSSRLDEDLLDYRKANNTPIGMSPYKLVYGKDFHLLIELKHKVMWAMKRFKID